MYNNMSETIQGIDNESWHRFTKIWSIKLNWRKYSDHDRATVRSKQKSLGYFVLFLKKPFKIRPGWQIFTSSKLIESTKQASVTTKMLRTPKRVLDDLFVFKRHLSVFCKSRKLNTIRQGHFIFKSDFYSISWSRAPAAKQPIPAIILTTSMTAAKASLYGRTCKSPSS